MAETFYEYFEDVHHRFSAGIDQQEFDVGLGGKNTFSDAAEIPVNI